MSDYARVMALVSAALDVDDAARDVYLVEAAAGDAALLAGARALLEADQRAGAFLTAPALWPGAPLGTGDAVGPYRIEGVLGEGGMGIVYRALDTRLGRVVALKAVAGATGDAAQARLEQEARAAAAISHPGIATVFAIERFDDALYLASALIDGETLRAVVERGPVPPEDVIRIGIALADALGAAHARGIIHGDLKPENVMRQPDGRVTILDFGLARVIDAIDVIDVVDPTGARRPAAGTPAYMAPEQLRGEPATAASDIYALGALLTELAGPDTATVPAPLAATLSRATARSAGDRFPSVTALHAALVACRDAAGPERARWWWHFHQVSAAGFALGLAGTTWALGGGATAAGLAVTGALVTTVLRLHRVFAVRVLNQPQAGRMTRWAITAADVATSGGALIGAFHLTPAQPVAAAVTAAYGIAYGLSRAVIEPATSRAARIDVS